MNTVSSINDQVIKKRERKKRIIGNIFIYQENSF